MPSSQKTPRRHASTPPTPFGDDFAHDVEARVLEVDVADARAPVAQRLDRVGAADEQVARVDEQVDRRQLEQPVDLGRRLDVRARVRVEDRREAACAGERLGAREAVGEALPAGIVEPQRRIVLAAARVGEALGRAAVAEDRSCRERAGGFEQVERALQLPEVAVDVLVLREADRAPAAGQLEPVRSSRARSSPPSPR